VERVRGPTRARQPDLHQLSNTNYVAVFFKASNEGEDREQ